jgi:excinuclease ABC subunit A
MQKDSIHVYGARQHNLKDVSLEIPRFKLVVFTGVSGSGKSSLAFDTIYAEGQRRYVESLSTYARQFLGTMDRPQVDHIDGLSPAIAIDQRSASSNPRSTVATVTDIHDYLRVLYARVGTPHCYQCGQEIAAFTPQQITDRIQGLGEGTRLQILALIAETDTVKQAEEALRAARRRGFARARLDGEIVDLSSAIRVPPGKHRIEIVVDRIIVDDKSRSRIAESVDTALREGDDRLIVNVLEDRDIPFSTRFACSNCDITYPELTPQMFSFNSPHGACPVCSGLGMVREIDPALLVADPDKSILDGALVVYGSLRTRQSRHLMEGLASHFGFNLELPWRDIPEEAKQAILHGTGDAPIVFEYETQKGKKLKYSKPFEGLAHAVARHHEETRSSSQKDYYSRFFADAPCRGCQGTRLRPESRAVKVAGLGIDEFARMSVTDAVAFTEGIHLEAAAGIVATELLKEILARLRFMAEVGVGYLTLDRPSQTLSGGEAQRIRLATQMGAGLAGVLYILDEPSIGLHARDQKRLLDNLFRLRDLGNTVIVVEHDPATMLAADYVVDFGPGAGVNGGEVIYAGDVAGLLACERSITGAYLSGKRSVPAPKYRRKGEGKLRVVGAKEHNLRNIDVDFPLRTLTCVSGVSGSGKSTLVHDILSRALRRKLYDALAKPGAHQAIVGAEKIDKVIDIDQSPIGRTPRSNPATYVRVFAEIRELFAQMPEARMRGYDAGRFSFNVRGGRCEACEGDGTKRVEMHFLPDVRVTCDECGGTRYNRETLQVTYKGRNIAEVLNLTISEALELFANVPKIERALRTLKEVGLDYIKLGQAADTLSGGEAQRIKLSRELAKLETGNTLYILDEPTTGLHFADVEKLLEVLRKLVDNGNTVLVIEHNLDVIAASDYVVDLGPEGGVEGGRVVAVGTPEQVAKVEGSYTGEHLRMRLAL